MKIFNLKFQSIDENSLEELNVANVLGIDSTMSKLFKINNNNNNYNLINEEIQQQQQSITLPIPTATMAPYSTELDDVFISVKTTRQFHYTRLPDIINTWFQHAKNQVSF